MPRRYTPEFRRRVLDLVQTGRSVVAVAADLEISNQTIYSWRRQTLDKLRGCRVLTMPS
jgi:transposase-like protein